MTSHLVIGDPHARPGVNNDRFEWLGRMALDRRPDVIVCMGDLFDMESLSSYDKGKRSFEGRRYVNDIAAGVGALQRFDQPISTFNELRKSQRKSQYRPRKVFILGNHEERVNRAANLHPELYGTFSYSDFKLVEFGWEIHDYLKPVEVNGIWYSHYFVSGVKGEAIGGVNIAGSLLSKNMASCIQGHTHILDYATRSRPDGKRMHAFSAGCFLDEGQHEPYAFATEFMWWRGVLYLHDVNDGDFDYETVSIRRIREMYGEQYVAAAAA